MFNLRRTPCSSITMIGETKEISSGSSIRGFFGTGASSGKAKWCEKLNDIPRMTMTMILTMTNILNLGSLTWRFIRVQATLAVNEMRGKNRIHKCGLAETRLTYTQREREKEMKDTKRQLLEW